MHLGLEVRLAVVAADSAAAGAARAAYVRIAELEGILSDWRPSSELRRLDAAPVGAWRPVSAPLFEVLSLALEVARATDGAFDPTVGPLSALWREAARTGRAVGVKEREAARARVGYRWVELDTAGRRVRFARAGMRLDLGAVAKGWIVDQALAVLRASGASAALVEAGGDLAVFGRPPGSDGWRVAVPWTGGRDTVLVLTSGAVSTSGADAQVAPGADGTEEGHVIRTATGRGVTDGRGATVLGVRAAVTDALATALTLVPPEAAPTLAARYGVRGALRAGAARPRR